MLSYQFLIIVLLLALPIYAQQTPKAFIGATLVNPGMVSIPDSVVVIKGGRILAAGPANQVKIPKGAERITAKRKWIIPGLTDAHVHFFQSGGLYTRPDVFDFRSHRSYEQEIEQIRKDLPDTFARYLRCGVTSVVDMGGPNWNFEVRNQAAKAHIAPRVWIAGPLLTPDSIKNPQTGTPHFLTTGADPAVIEGVSEAQVRAEVRRQAALKADLIKIWGPGMSSTPKLLAIYDEAKKQGLPVAVHATELAEARLAVTSGAKILVHSIEDKQIPDDLIAEMKGRGVILIPTLTAMRGYKILLETRKYSFDPWEFELANPHVMGTLFDLLQMPQELDEASIKAIQTSQPWQVNPVMLDNLKRLVHGGVTVATGTDAGNPGTFHGATYFTELKLMAQAGLTPKEILACATINGAKVVGKEKELGSIEVGKRADLLVLDADPLETMLNSRYIHLVVKDGEVYLPAEILKHTAVDLVQRQVNAYNARDSVAFAATYAANVSIRTLPDQSEIMSGRGKLQKDYAELFLQMPDTVVRITNRMTDGSFVVDQEQFLHRWDRSKSGFAGTAIYEVKDGLIQTVWFLVPPKPAK